MHTHTYAKWHKHPCPLAQAPRDLVVCVCCGLQGGRVPLVWLLVGPDLRLVRVAPGGPLRSKMEDVADFIVSPHPRAALGLISHLGASEPWRAVALNLKVA